MKFFKIMLSVLLFTALLPNPFVMAQEEGPQYIVTTTNGVSLTASADEKGMVVAKLSKGARVNFVRQQDNWVKVDYKGRLGWVPSETIAPFTADLLSIYAGYYQQLSKFDHIIYALVADFTQDGIEDLYIVSDADPSKGQYEEYIYSGEQLIYQKNSKSGLTILKNGDNYYVYHHTQTNDEKKYKLKQLNSQAKTDYFEVSAGKESYEITANSYVKSYFVLSAGDGSLDEQTFTYEQVASKDYYGAELKNDYEESIYLENYALSKDGQTTTLMEQDYRELFSTYEKSKVIKVIYDDHYKSSALNERFQFDSNRIKKELLDLAETVLPEKQFDFEQTELEKLQLMLDQSVYLEIPYKSMVERNMLTYFKAVQRGIAKGMTGFDSTQLLITNNETAITYERASIDQIIYDFYGVKMKPDDFNQLANDTGYLMTDENYVANIIEETQVETYIYRQLLAIETLENGYIALNYTDYEMPHEMKVSPANESMIIAGNKVGQGYVLLKRLPFKSDVKFVYIDTVDSLDYLNVNQFGVYENSLDAIQKLSAEQKAGQTEEKQEMEVTETEEDARAQLEAEAEPPISWWLLLGGAMLVVSTFASSYYFYRKRIFK
ncbi:SH3 domain-containing protein [Solibacillus daqui]|uniref:SH3 domain-containing protein n=1 Tax=Solibacillus daqui TaxID=2912187 RepID=UPI002366658C|nr:SH3 domain-containing protein [Solibacillus daqui]